MNEIDRQVLSIVSGAMRSAGRDRIGVVAMRQIHGTDDVAFYSMTFAAPFPLDAPTCCALVGEIVAGVQPFSGCEGLN